MEKQLDIPAAPANQQSAIFDINPRIAIYKVKEVKVELGLRKAAAVS